MCRVLYDLLAFTREKSIVFLIYLCIILDPDDPRSYIHLVCRDHTSQVDLLTVVTGEWKSHNSLLIKDNGLYPTCTTCCTSTPTGSSMYKSQTRILHTFLIACIPILSSISADGLLYILPQMRYFIKTTNGHVLVCNRRFIRKRVPTSLPEPPPPGDLYRNNHPLDVRADPANQRLKK